MEAKGFGPARGGPGACLANLEFLFPGFIRCRELSLAGSSLVAFFLLIIGNYPRSTAVIVECMCTHVHVHEHAFQRLKKNF